MRNNHLIGSKELHGCLHTRIRNGTDVRVDEHIILRAGADVIRGSLQGIRLIRLNINLLPAADMVRCVCLSLSLLIHIVGQQFENPLQKFGGLLLSLFKIL
ncbi:hypothetical protein TIFTF001_022043 [Ficus carica]|uniref:Uncharacterized protein n=1 Tax=Ficus carica TaxID=3494 RepID=A0AA88AJ61_FICCA|nr:hypothetical protein TIFTF001_022043 [Ficus carica]